MGEDDFADDDSGAAVLVPRTADPGSGVHVVLIVVWRYASELLLDGKVEGGAYMGGVGKFGGKSCQPGN